MTTTSTAGRARGAARTELAAALLSAALLGAAAPAMAQVQPPAKSRAASSLTSSTWIPRSLASRPALT